MDTGLKHLECLIIDLYTRGFFFFFHAQHAVAVGLLTITVTTKSDKNDVNSKNN